MIPGVNPRQMQQMMKQMGVQQVDVDATRVIIECPDKRIVIENPSVARVTMMGQQTWQISGPSREEALSMAAEITDEDVQTVVDATDASAEDARAAIEEAEGDLAQAILNLKGE
jgi:nascent polypeptide-associated complex subunit alpha